MKRFLRVAVTSSIGAIMLAACSKHPQVTPLPQLPTLERSIVQTSARKDGNLHIPATALTERGGIPGVFVLEEGEARFRMVKIGRRAGDRVDILSGLTGNELLVLGDLAPVRDGSPIKRRGN